MRALILLAGLALLVPSTVGCDDDEPEAADPPAADDDPAEQRDPDDEEADEQPEPAGPGSEAAGEEDPLADLETADAAVIVPVADEGTDEIPARGCAAQGAPARLWEQPGPTAIVAAGDRFVVAGYAQRQDGDGEELFVVGLRAGERPVPLHRAAIEPAAPGGRQAPPGLAPLDAGRVVVAVTDAEGAVRIAALSAAEPTADPDWAEAASEGADLRFAPAVSHVGPWRLVAWVDGRGAPMRVRLARVKADGEVGSVHDVTPEAMGATAPTFLAGASPPTLLFADARAAISPVLRVRMAEDGTPGDAEVARPVGSLFEPPELAAARVGSRIWLGYTAVGSAATTAVGLLRIDGDSQGAPVPLVPGTGYGRLDVAAAAAPDAALFAMSAPKARAKDAPREVRVRRVDERGPGPAAVLVAPDGRAAQPAVARAEDGTVGVSFRSPAGSWVALLRCAGVAP